jgi:nucleoside-diphosphate-sugar epimerase
MKFLVTGGLGFIGHAVVRCLEQLGHSVVITDTRTGYGIIPQTEIDYLVDQRRRRIATDRIHAIDITDQSGIDWLFRTYDFDCVIHLASFPRQKVVNQSPQAGSRAMSEGLLNLLEATAQHQVNKFVYVSSSMVYGNFTESGFDGVDEYHPTRPIGQYGIMKLAGEWLVKDYAQRTGVNYTIVRPSAVYGPLDVEDRVVSKFLLNAIRGQSVSVNGAEEELDFTYVDDAAQGIACASIEDIANNQTYNITRGQSRTLLEAAELAVKIAGQGQVEVNNRDKNFPSRGQLNITQAYKDFGFQPKVDIEEGFKQYYDWLTEHSIYWSQKTV